MEVGRLVSEAFDNDSNDGAVARGITVAGVVAADTRVFCSVGIVSEGGLEEEELRRYLEAAEFFEA